MMKMLFLPKEIRQRLRIDDAPLSDVAQARLDKLKAVDALVAAGCDRDVAMAQQGLSRRTCYRWKAALRRHGPKGLEARSTRPRRVRRRAWGQAELRAVIAMRERFPFMGARALRVMLARDGMTLSVGTVQRIVQLCLKRKWIKPVAWLRGRAKPKKRRNFTGAWAQRWRRGMRAEQPGDVVQIDHMSVSRDGQTLKEFRAVDPITRVMVCQVFSRATARNAKRFLAAVLAQMPFSLSSVQVDGGSEFQADFEQACEAHSLPMAVLPPKSPQLNGHVERCNDTRRVEFWALYTGDLTVSAAAAALAKYQQWHNAERPHSALDYASPLEHLAKLQNMQMVA